MKGGGGVPPFSATKTKKVWILFSECQIEYARRYITRSIRSLVFKSFEALYKLLHQRYYIDPQHSIKQRYNTNYRTMWGMGNNNSGSQNYNRDDSEHQHRMAAAAAQMAQLQVEQQAQMNYNPNANDFYNNINAYQAFQHDMSNNALLEERRRVEIALAVQVQEQEAAQQREAQLRQALYEREIASLAASDFDMRRSLLEQQMAGAVRELGGQNSGMNNNSSNSHSHDMMDRDRDSRSQLEFLQERMQQEMLRSHGSNSITSSTSPTDPVNSAQFAPHSRIDTAMDSLATMSNDYHSSASHDFSGQPAEPIADEEPTSTADITSIDPPDPPDPPDPTPSTDAPPPSPIKKKKKRATPSSSSTKKPATKKTPVKRTPKKGSTSPLNSGTQPYLSEQVPSISDAEYANLDLVMEQFCKVPLLAEFSRPISLLHPELVPIYSKVIPNPIDLGKVCRAIRKREYENTRQVCVDVWRIFSNCVKYHTHPLTRDGAIPSFISIASHLRDYFNALWLEYMIPSEIPKADGNDKDAVMTSLQNAEVKRLKFRGERRNSVASVVLTSKLIEKACNTMIKFVQMEGRVDDLDEDSIVPSPDDAMESRAVNGVFTAIVGMATRLREIAHSDYEYTVESLTADLKRCYGDEVFEGFPWLQIKFAKRLERMLGKLVVPVNEVSCRGVNQSSVWGCMAAAIWARENTKKPYWPALVLGILAPDDQREDWHSYLTQRNEARLPEKLQTGLQTGKKKALQAIQRQNEGKAERMSYFLVEFLGTHEFIWVREADIIENFDPEEDVNQQLASVGNITKKKKTSLRGQTAANAKMLQKATDEGRWALEEFEMLLSDPCGDQLEEYADDGEEENYTFPVLCESDDEADEADIGTSAQMTTGTGNQMFETPTGVIAELDEVTELIATDGKLDHTSEGRKNAKKRAAALKKQAAEEKRTSTKKKKESKPAKVSSSKGSSSKGSSSKVSCSKASTSKTDNAKRLSDLEYKKEQKDLEKRRKKRTRERERVTKDSERKAKKMKVDGNSTMIRKGRKLGIANKRGRAVNLVKGYLNRIAAQEEMKGLGLGGVSTLPAANVDGSGLIGLALAFRAAAGEIDMPNSDDNPSSLKPWDNIDVDGPITSEDRCKNLEKQLELLEMATLKLDEDDERRKTLIDAAIEDKIIYDKTVLDAENDARQNDMPKRKVSNKRKNSIDKKEADESTPCKKKSSATKEEVEEEEEEDAEHDTAADLAEEVSLAGDEEETKAEDLGNEPLNAEFIDDAGEDESVITAEVLNEESEMAY